MKWLISKKIFLLSALFLGAFHPILSHAKPVIVATVPALGQIAQAVGGVDVRVHVITRIGQDPRTFSPHTPDARLIMQANLLFAAGFGLESSWLPALVKLASNPKVEVGTKGYFSGADAIHAIGVPLGMVSDSLDPWSPEENPYWWLDPENGIKAANVLAVRLGEIDSVNARRYLQRAYAFSRAVKKAIPRWKEDMQILKKPVVTYHDTYHYFIEAMDVELASFVEPKPGIEPSTRHLTWLIQSMKERGVGQLWVEPYHTGPTSRRVANEVGIRMLVIPDAIDGDGQAAYIGLFDYIIERVGRWSQ
ncbi:MAG: metal ABC transporter substrate-binding protein [Mariprofundaceae bacterium]